VHIANMQHEMNPMSHHVNLEKEGFYVRFAKNHKFVVAQYHIARR
jgi:hypothetical protein